MPKPSPFGRPEKRRPGSFSRAPLDDDRSRLSKEEEAVRLKELELRKKAAEAQRRLTDLPLEIEKKKQEQREMMILRAKATTTLADGFIRPRDKRHDVAHAPSRQKRRTGSEKRSARNQLLLLCVILGALLLILWRTIPTTP